ncbi:54S ribosomal protein L2, mitochondrial [Candida viswanathii]|uniref:Large ribosomal subunit protein bL27m n=1 Tax=Candida viswanathii TaxID=5486 RepID=A0A367YKA7_9ASCO|nr:54S ribosomal protein L2, mitochondrial [Candida viswanathii]
MSSVVKGLFGSTRRSIDLTSSPLNIAIQIRTAKKRVSGSRTNNKDSAGRRLGVKVPEGHFVNIGEIIMKQRGTVIHPGENTNIGTDHTIVAKEPGYVRFYLDPFHPKRKYVGVALKKDVRLPKPHFEPRLRRFGFIPIENPTLADREEASMLRKEHFEWSEEAKLKAKEQFLESTKEALNSVYALGLEGKELEDAAERLHYTYQLRLVGQTLKEARVQATYNKLFDLSLQVRKGEITANQLQQLQSSAKEFSSKIDSAVGVETNGALFKNLSEETLPKLQQEVRDKLAKLYAELALDTNYRQQARELIYTAGVFETKEREELVRQYVPDVLPEEVPGSLFQLRIQPSHLRTLWYNVSMMKLTERSELWEDQRRSLLTWKAKDGAV